MTWYVFRTAPRKEFSVEQILRNRGLSVLVPTETKWRRMGRKRKEPHAYPMLPRYIFASGCDPWVICRALEGRGIVGVVSFEGRPAPIADAAVHRLARLSGKASQSNLTRVHKAFVVGDQVEIGVGPYRGHLVEIQSIKGRAARVLLPMFGVADMPVDIDLDQLEAA